MSVSAPTLWDKFQQIQGFADSRRINHLAWAIDEVAEEILDRLAKPLTDPQHVTNDFREMVWNRKKKHQRRKEFLLTRYSNESVRRTMDMPEPSKSSIDNSRNESAVGINTKEMLEAVKSQVTTQEWELLCHLANEVPFEKLSSVWGEPAGTLKSRVSRCRQRVRLALWHLLQK